MPDWTTAKAGSSFSVESLFVAGTLSGYVALLATVKTISHWIGLFTAIFMVVVWRSTLVTVPSTLVGGTVAENMLARAALETSFEIPFFFFGWEDDFFFLLYFFHDSLFLIFSFFLQSLIRIDDVVLWIIKGLFELSEFMIETFSFGFVLFDLFG